jgi:DNA-binding transcriptional MerR regulator
MLIGELARRSGRTTDTIKRWVDDGLIACERDERNRRVFREEQVAECRELARLSLVAQLTNRKLSQIAQELPEQLRLLDRKTG